MVNTYSLNPTVLPSTPLPKEEHHRTITGGIVSAVIVIILGLAYWWWASIRQAPTAPVNTESQLRSEVASILRNSNVQPSQTEINTIATQLSKSSATTDPAVRQNVASQLGHAQAGEF